ncbi:MAG TPA: hypothetical protein VHP37_24885 [Burkholderiales bacterium]|nr:hypothetical protein [Burkholderiales bacterium]
MTDAVRTALRVSLAPAQKRGSVPEMFEVSSYTGEGSPAWYAWLQAELQRGIDGQDRS